MKYLEIGQEIETKIVAITDDPQTYNSLAVEWNVVPIYSKIDNIDIFDLADKTREKLENDFSNLFADYDYFNERSGAKKMFTHIKNNQLFYLCKVQK